MVSTRRGSSYKPTLGSYGRNGRQMEAKRKRDEASRLREEKEDEKKARPNTRSRTNETASSSLLATPPDFYKVVDTPESNPGPQRRSKGGPTCSNFGDLRHIFYKSEGFFFCSSCDLWDREHRINPMIKRTSQCYSCKANHTSFVWPTDKRKKQVSSNSVGNSRRATRQLYRKDEDPEGLQDDSSIDALEASNMKDVSSGAEMKRANDFTDLEQSCVLDSQLSVKRMKPSFPSEDILSSKPSVTMLLNDLKQYLLSQKETDTPQTNILLQRISFLELSLQEVLKEKEDLKSSLEAEHSRLNQAKSQLQVVNRRVRYLSSKTDVPSVEPREESANDRTKSQGIKEENKRFQASLARLLKLMLTSDTFFCKWKAQRIEEQLLQFVISYGGAQELVVKYGRSWLRKNVYTPYRILREMDLAGGSLSYEGIEILRRVESQGVSRVYCVLPSSAELKRAGAKVELVGHAKCPFVLSSTPHGEKISFERKKTVGTVFGAYQLLGVGREKSLNVADSLDGSQISKNLSHICGGFKISDRCARCPLSGKLLLGDDISTLNAQSRDLCFPLEILMARETKETFKEFEGMFKFFEDCTSESTNPFADLNLKPLTVVANCDMAAQWKALCKGGAAKQHRLPCHCCALPGNTWAEPNATPCDQWCRELHAENPEWKCYHHLMATNENVENWRAELTALTDALTASIETIDELSLLEHEDAVTPAGNASSNPRSIHFEPKSGEERAAYSNFLTNELMHRDLSPLGNWLDRRERLREAVIAEQKVRHLTHQLKHCEPQEGALFLLIQAIPCILHLENRVGLKIMTMLFIQGLSNAKKGYLFAETNGQGARIEMYFAMIADVMNKQILGTEESKTQWDCPRDSSQKEIGTITMDNERTRKVIDSLELLVECSLVDEVEKEKWLLCIPKYRSAMCKLRTKKDMQHDDVVSFQRDADDFFQLWVELFGLHGCTNYIHMLSSGHLATYLFKWKNLYRHSQQGWEALNALLKTFFFRRTLRGGATNQGNGRSSRLLPIGRWLQRRIIWLCGFNENTIQQYLESNQCTVRSGSDMDLNNDVHGGDDENESA